MNVPSQQQQAEPRSEGLGRRCLRLLRGDESASGFTLLELMIALAVSSIIIVSVYNLYIAQSSAHRRQKEILIMNQNGRAGVDYLIRAIQNAGYGVTRGQRFEAASDHYIVTVCDQNDNGVVSNDEILVFAVSKPSGAATESFTIAPYFDQDGDGVVDASETRMYTIPLVLGGPPYNLYRFILSQTSSSVTKVAIAENFDNLIFSYFDEDELPLPVTYSGVSRVAPPLPFDFSGATADLNSIRRIEIEAMVRTEREADTFNTTGTYEDDTVATYDTLGNAQTGISYNDAYRRRTLKTSVAPRNLVVGNLGRLTIEANPNPIECPASSSTVTAILVDTYGEPLSGASIDFSVSDGILSSDPVTTDAGGVATTALVWDWSDPNKTITLGASAVIDIDPGPDVDNRTLYNAKAVYFEAGTTAVFFDDFQDGDDDGWTVVSGNWMVAANKTYKINSPQDDSITVAGCPTWQDYGLDVMTYQVGAGQDEYRGVLLRYQDATHYYLVEITNDDTHPVPNSELRIVLRDGTETVLGTTPIAYDHNDWYHLKTQVEGNVIKAKYWKDGQAEPGWMLQATDGSSTYVDGMIGLRANSDNGRFDDMQVGAVE